MHPIPKVYGLGNNIKACRPVYGLERERKYIGSILMRASLLWIQPRLFIGVGVQLVFGL
jgi:hypothetical protein